MGTCAPSTLVGHHYQLGKRAAYWEQGKFTADCLLTSPLDESVINASGNALVFHPRCGSSVSLFNGFLSAHRPRYVCVYSYLHICSKVEIR